MCRGRGAMQDTTCPISQMDNIYRNQIQVETFILAAQQACIAREMAQGGLHLTCIL